MSESNLTPLPSPTYEIQLRPSADIGKRGELKWVPVDKLMIDNSYQRPVGADGKRNIRRIVEGFHFSLFSPVVVAPRRNGRYAVIDGQHRAIAAALHGGVDELPALVLKCSEADEARAFHTINGTVTRVNIQYLFRARVAAGDKDALACVDVCDVAGARIIPYPVQSSQLKPGETLACGTIEKCLSRYGREILVRAIELITKTGDGNPGLVAQALIVGGCIALERNPKWLKHPQLLKAVGAIGVPALRAGAMRRMAEQLGTLSANYADELFEKLWAVLGDGGAREVKTINEKQREAARREQNAIAAAKRTGGGAPKKAEASNRATADEREAIDAFLKKQEPRKFESGATGNVSDLIDWLNVHTKRKAQRTGAARAGGKIYLVDGKRHSLEAFLEIVNAERKKKKLEPIFLGAPTRNAA